MEDKPNVQNRRSSLRCKNLMNQDVPRKRSSIVFSQDILVTVEQKMMTEKNEEGLVRRSN